MRLAACRTAKPGHVVTCVQCGRKVPLEYCKINLDGNPFRAYYCTDGAKCASNPKPEEPIPYPRAEFGEPGPVD